MCSSFRMKTKKQRGEHAIQLGQREMMLKHGHMNGLPLMQHEGS